MIEEVAVVIKTEGEFAWVEKARQSACGSCSQSEGCGVSMLDRWFGQRMVQIRGLNQAAAEPGDRVILGMAEQALLKAALLVYLFPIILMLLFAVIGSSMLGNESEQSELWSIGAGITGLVFGMLLVRYYLRVFANRYTTMQAVILRRAD